MEMIAAIIGLVFLIMFIVIASNVGSIKNHMKNIYTNGYKQYACGSCQKPFWGKHPKCPNCDKPIGW